LAEPLKNCFDRVVVRRIGAMMLSAHPAFPERRFVAEASRGLGSLELMDRARHVAAALARALPGDFDEAARILIASLDAPLDRTEGFGMSVFLYLPHVIFVAESGLDHFESAMAAQHALTRRFTAEFSIRAFLDRDPERTLARLRQWARDPDVHVRRLVSEGTRPRLPWAPRLRAFQRDPRPVLALLELLRDDPEIYVRRSVANNLNDIGKDHPALLVEVCARWSRRASAERLALIRHALRWLVKKGDPGALRVLGFSGGAEIRVTGRIRPRRLRVGETCAILLSLENRGRATRSVVVDLAVHYVKADGSARAKVFKVRSLRLLAGEKATAGKVISFAQRTTRRHHPGRHRVDALVNGRAVRVGHVDVIGPARPR
jgi:3-methyladenine DNA glycosylase AlkC